MSKFRHLITIDTWRHLVLFVFYFGETIKLIFILLSEAKHLLLWFDEKNLEVNSLERVVQVLINVVTACWALLKIWSLARPPLLLHCFADQETYLNRLLNRIVGVVISTQVNLSENLVVCENVSTGKISVISSNVKFVQKPGKTLT